MKSPWSLGTQTPEIESYMKMCIEKKNDYELCNNLLDYTRRNKNNLHPLLYKLFIKGFEMHLNDPTHETHTFVCEVCAAYHYKFKNKSAGNLEETLKSLEGNPYIAQYVVQKCSKIKCETTQNGNQWFKIRIMVMDVVTSFKMLRSSTLWNIFYGGNTHSVNISEILNIEGMCNCEKLNELHNLSSYVKSITNIENVLDKKIYTILGENHNETKMEFADKLLEFCKEKCKGEEKVSVFIEKHPSNGVDFVQQNLTCNMQDNVTIQKFRCNYPMCENVEFYDIDVRHVELGFLRYEFLCLDYDEEFKNLSESFQELCLNHIMSISLLKLV